MVSVNFRRGVHPSMKFRFSANIFWLLLSCKACNYATYIYGQLSGHFSYNFTVRNCKSSKTVCACFTESACKSCEQKRESLGTCFWNHAFRCSLSFHSPL